MHKPNKRAKYHTRKQGKNDTYGELTLCEECQEQFDEIFTDILCIEDEVQDSLRKREFVRATHIFEAPLGAEGEYVWTGSDDDSFDLYIFLSGQEFALLKAGLGLDSDRSVVRRFYSRKEWKGRLAS